MYITKELSIRKIAAAIGTSKDVIFQALRRYGISRRSNTYYSKLWLFSLKQIERRINLRGKRGAAIYFGVHHSTLLYHLKRRRFEKKDWHSIYSPGGGFRKRGIYHIMNKKSKSKQQKKPSR
jgi:hypothetical protein